MFLNRSRGTCSCPWFQRVGHRGRHHRVSLYIAAAAASVVGSGATAVHFEASDEGRLTVPDGSVCEQVALAALACPLTTVNPEQYGMGVGPDPKALGLPKSPTDQYFPQRRSNCCSRR